MKQSKYNNSLYLNLAAVSATLCLALVSSSRLPHTPKNSSNRAIAEEALAPTTTCPGANAQETWTNCNPFNANHVGALWDLIVTHTAPSRENIVSLYHLLFKDYLTPNVLGSSQSSSLFTIQSAPPLSLPEILNQATGRPPDGHYGALAAYMWTTAGIGLSHNNLIIYDPRETQAIAQDQTPHLFAFTDVEIYSLYSTIRHLPKKLKHMGGGISINRLPPPHTVFDINARYAAYASAGDRQIVLGTGRWRPQITEPTTLSLQFNTVMHELAHIYDYYNHALYEQYASQSAWLDLSGWEIADVVDRRTGVTTRQWVPTREGAAFYRDTTRPDPDYSSTNPSEDYADAVSYHAHKTQSFSDCCREKQDYIADDIFEMRTYGIRNNDEAWWQKKLTSELLLKILGEPINGASPAVTSEELAARWQDLIYTHALPLLPEASAYFSSVNTSAPNQVTLRERLYSQIAQLAAEYTGLPLQTKSDLHGFMSNTVPRTTLVSCLIEHQGQRNRRPLVKDCYNQAIHTQLTALQLPDAWALALADNNSFHSAEAAYMQSINTFAHVLERKQMQNILQLIDTCASNTENLGDIHGYVEPNIRDVTVRRNFRSCLNRTLQDETLELINSTAAELGLQLATITKNSILFSYRNSLRSIVARHTIKDILQRRAQVNIQASLTQLRSKLSEYENTLTLLGAYEGYAMSLDQCTDLITSTISSDPELSTNLSSSPYFESLLTESETEALCREYQGHYSSKLNTEQRQALQYLQSRALSGAERIPTLINNFTAWAQEQRDITALVPACETILSTALSGWTANSHDLSLSADNIKNIIIKNYCTVQSRPVVTEESNRHRLMVRHLYPTLPPSHAILAQPTTPNQSAFISSCTSIVSTRVLQWLESGLPRPPTTYIQIPRHAQAITQNYCEAAYDERVLFNNALQLITHYVTNALTENTSWTTQDHTLRLSCERQAEHLIIQAVENLTQPEIQTIIRPLINNATAQRTTLTLNGSPISTRQLVTRAAENNTLLNVWQNYVFRTKPALCAEFIDASEQARRALSSQVQTQRRRLTQDLRRELRTRASTPVLRRALCPQVAQELLTAALPLDVDNRAALSNLVPGGIAGIIEQNAARMCQNL